MVDSAFAPALQAAYVMLVIVVPFAVLHMTIAYSSVEAALALSRDWESAATAVLADVAMATTPAASATITALRSAAPEKELEVMDELAWAAARARWITTWLAQRMAIRESRQHMKKLYQRSMSKRLWYSRWPQQRRSCKKPLPN